MAEDAQQVVSSPTEPTAVDLGLPDLNKFTPEERLDWQKKGTPFKAPETPSPKAESTPATKPAAEEAETAADSGTASEQGKAKGADVRIQELLAERHQLRNELEQLKKTPKAESSPADTAKPVEKKAEGEPAEPEFATFSEQGKSWADYQEARKQWQKDHTAWLLTESEKRAEIKLTERQQREAADQLWAEGEKVHGKEIHEARDRVIAATTPEMQIAMSATKDVVGLIAHLGKPENEGKLKELVTQFRENPYVAIMTLGRMADALEKPTPEATPGKVVTTKAPRPVTEINGRNSATPDPRKAAIENDDPRAYIELENQRELEKRRKRA